MTPPETDCTNYWRNKGATHAQLGPMRSGPLKDQVLTSLGLPQYYSCLTAYLIAFDRAIAAVEQAVTEREKLAL